MKKLSMKPRVLELGTTVCTRELRAGIPIKNIAQRMAHEVAGAIADEYIAQMDVHAEPCKYCRGEYVGFGSCLRCGAGRDGKTWFGIRVGVVDPDELQKMQTELDHLRRYREDAEERIKNLATEVTTLADKSARFDAISKALDKAA